MANELILVMSIVEPLGAVWLMKTLEANPSIIINGFKDAGIL